MADGPPLPAELPALQRFLDAWIKQRGRYWSPLSQYARLVEEVGVAGRELNCRWGDKPRTVKDDPGSIADERGDVLFVVVLLANYQDIDLASALTALLQKYDHRTEG